LLSYKRAAFLFGKESILIHMATAESENNVTNLAVDRAVRIRDYVENLISLVGEHPECELKANWTRGTPFHRAEVIKDIQATANSVAPNKEKYIVVGVDQQTRKITGCNPTEYDDASIRQLLERYLDPAPQFEVLSLKSSSDVDFVVFRIPYQENRPIFAKAQIRGDNNRIHLDVGQVWIKPGGAETGSTGKRLVSSREELVGLVNIDQRVMHEVDLRIQQLLPDIRLEERTRLAAPENAVLPVFTSTDEEFEAYVEQLLVGEKINHLHIALEKLRDRTTVVWGSALDDGGKISVERIQAIKENDFLPAMRRLVLLGMLLIKFSAPAQWFSAVIDLLVETFAVSHLLRRAQSPLPSDAPASSLAEHTSYTVPALESLIAVYVFAAYALVTRKRYEYLRTMFPRTVDYVRGPDEDAFSSFFLFWPLTYRWGTPDIRRDLLIADRYARGDRIESLLGGEQRIKAAIMQVDCLIDWHSVLAQPAPEGEPETRKFFESSFPEINNWYTQNFTRESLRNIVPLIKKFWENLLSSNDQLFLDPALGQIFGDFELERRKQILAKFLVYAERSHGEVMWAQQRFPFNVFWEPTELNILVRSVKARR
jgi:Schlafen, AlbA_2